MNWENKDWRWLTGILVALLAASISFWVWCVNLDGYFSVLASAVSIALALVAIFIALKQDTEATRTNNMTQQLLTSIDEKVNGLRDNLMRIEERDVYNKSAEYEGNSGTGNPNGVSRIHGVISSSVDWSPEEFVKKVGSNLANYNQQAKIIDYSIIGMEVTNPPFKKSKLISLIISIPIDERYLEIILESSLDDLHVHTRGMKMYYNPGIRLA